MKYRQRTYYTDEQKSMMWDRWQKGETLGSIARLFDRHHASIAGIIAQSGGIRPAPRHRSSRCLSLTEREEISRGIAVGQSLRFIATRLNRSPSTISREIQRRDLSRYCCWPISTFHCNPTQSIAFNDQS